MISGREALHGLEQTIFGLRADEGRLDAALASANDEAARARRAEADGFRALARIKLDLLAQTELLSDLDSTERRALDMIAGERAMLAALERKRSDALNLQHQAEDNKRESGRVLAEAIEALEAKHRLVAQAVTAAPDWQKAKLAVDAARQTAQAAAEKSQRASDDLAQKRKPYENDPLFMYLWQRKHGTGEDRTGFFVRFFDRRVARLIGYADARANYAMLLSIPARLGAHAAVRQQSIADAREAQSAIERQALVAAGIGPLEAALQAAQVKDQAAQAAAAAAAAAVQAVEGERTALVQHEDGGRKSAIVLLADRLSRSDMRQLYAEAFKTPTPDDENALNAITRARQAIAKADQDTAKIRSQIQDMARKRAELESARDGARAQGYDSPWGNFANHVLISDIIRGIVAGALSSSDLGRAMAGEYRRRDPGFGGNWGGGFGSSGGQSPWGGQSSSPPPSSSGWRTTDSF